MDAVLAADLLCELESRGITVWLEGGWAIDALLGEQTREHDDLDVLVAVEDVARLEAALGARGYAHAGSDGPSSFYLVDSAGRQVDVHLVSFAPSGDATYVMGHGREWVYPAAAFDAVGTIAGRAVRPLSAPMMMVNHTTGYALDAVHQRDVELLSDRFEIPLPAFQAAD